MADYTTLIGKGVHKTVFRRLLLGWLLLSVLLGGVVFYIEMEKVDSFVVRLALSESAAALGDLRSIDFSQAELLQQKVDELVDRHFHIAEIYDSNQAIIAQAVRSGAEDFELALHRFMHRFPSSDKPRYQKFYLSDGTLLLQVVAPLKRPDGKLLGYFEGVYHVGAEMLRDIRRDVAVTLALTVFIILATTVMLYPIIISLNRGLLALSNDLLKSNIELMEALGRAVDKRDSATYRHNYRVTIYAIRLAEALQLPGQQIRDLIAGAFLHDVGKIGISDNILLKGDKLNEEEFNVMKTHVRLGADIVAKADWLRGARDVIEFHQEKYDGSGYLRGLKGEEIPLNARIFAIADVFDALTSRRPYKEPLSFEEAMRIINQGRGTHFDPRLLNKFAEIAPQLYTAISEVDDQVVEKMLEMSIDKYFFGKY
ncbi:MAG: HD domain-containing phosphohydrolase [Pseudomonadota bacterium]